MSRYALGRLAGLIPVLFAAVVLTFIATRFVPGDPISILLGNHAGDPELESRLRADYGLDRPLVVQFFSYLGDIANGTFGMSFRFARMPVIDVIWTGLSITPIIALAALFVSVPIGVVLGTTAALHRRSAVDTGIILVLIASRNLSRSWIGTTNEPGPPITQSS